MVQETDAQRYRRRMDEAHDVLDEVVVGLSDHQIGVLVDGYSEGPEALDGQFVFKVGVEAGRRLNALIDRMNKLVESP